MARDLNKTCGGLRASSWLVLSLLVFISPFFAISHHWTKRDDARQPAAQAVSSSVVAAARPTAPGNDFIAIQIDGNFVPPPRFTPECSVSHYRCYQIIEVSDFNPRAPPRG